MTIDLDRDGKQIGVVWVTDAFNDDSAWGSLAVPIACLKNGEGPTVVLCGGNHGDEYEGQVALRRLLTETAADDVTGTLILLPCLSPPAARAVRRLWPDGNNFNRVFPGAPTGPASRVLAHWLTNELFPRADVVGDFHSGGRTLLFPPMATMHLVDDPVQRRAMLEAALAMNTDWMLVYSDIGGDGLLPGEVERQGKVMVSSELGGAGMLTTDSMEAAYSGIANVARQVGVLRGEVQTREQLGKHPTRIVQATEPRELRARAALGADGADRAVREHRRGGRPAGADLRVRRARARAAAGHSTCRWDRARVATDPDRRARRLHRADRGRGLARPAARVVARSSV